ncbi:MAG: aminotransferase class I/II-fold pyridoxal phosphate-dependent enzyme [Promethearchaeota archaeon]
MRFNLIQKTPLYNAFSELGKRILLPDGIYYWSGRAKKEAELIGTIGSAYAYEKDFIDGGRNEWLPCYLKDILEYSSLAVKEIVPYASIGGLSETREIWKNWMIKKSLYNEESEKSLLERLEKYISHPVITAGITNGIFQSCAMFLNPDEIIIAPNKRWGNYDNIITKFIGARIKSFEFFEEDHINIDALEAAINETAKIQDKIIIILNFPNNPTGYVPTNEEVREIVNLLRKSYKLHSKPIIMIIDDAYEPFIYSKNVLNTSLFYDLHQLDENIIPIKLDGITKELLAYGGRIGFITIGIKPSWIENDDQLELLKSEIQNKFEGFNRATISNCNHFYQSLTYKLFIDKGIEQIIKSRDKVKQILKKRYKKINAELSKINNPNISIDPNSGGFFLFVNLNPTKYSANKFADYLLKKYKVGIIPMENPDEKINGIRIAYCSIDFAEIPELTRRINLALNDF